MAMRRPKAAGVALGLLAGLGGGLLGYRSYALRKQAAAPAPATEAIVASAPAEGAAPRSPHANETPPGAAAAPPADPEQPTGTAAEREAKLLARLAAPAPDSPAAREAELLRRVDSGLLPAATRPLLQTRPLAPVGPERLARAEAVTRGREADEERRASLGIWPAIQESEPPPGPPLPVARPPPPRPRPPRLELPARLDQWGE